MQSLILDVLTTLYTSDAVIEQVPGISNKYPKRVPKAQASRGSGGMNNRTDFHRRFQSGVHDQHLSSSVASLDLEE